MAGELLNSSLLSLALNRSNISKLSGVLAPQQLAPQPQQLKIAAKATADFIKKKMKNQGNFNFLEMLIKGLNTTPSLGA